MRFIRIFFGFIFRFVIPAKAGISTRLYEIPAFAAVAGADIF